MSGAIGGRLSVCVQGQEGAVWSCGFCVFFQAEDGIRDLVRSRGLGDVYKRQGVHRARGRVPGLDVPPGGGRRCIGVGPPGARRQAVSYTHLTLPTSDLA